MIFIHENIRTRTENATNILNMQIFIKIVEISNMNEPYQFQKEKQGVGPTPTNYPSHSVNIGNVRETYSVLACKKNRP